MAKTRPKAPYLAINMAMSVDGKVTSRSYEPVTFTSREDKRLLWELRSRCDALVVGAHTVEIDHATMSISDPKLRAARLRRGQTEYPIRVIVSGRLHVPLERVFQIPVSPILIVCAEAAPRHRQKEFARRGHLLVCGRKEVDIRRLLWILHSDYRAEHILSEGGPTLNDALFRSGLVNELYVTLCPRIIGGRNAPTLVEGTGIPHLKDAVRGKLVSCRRGTTEWFLKYRMLPS